MEKYECRQYRQLFELFTHINLVSRADVPLDILFLFTEESSVNKTHRL